VKSSNVSAVNVELTSPLSTDQQNNTRDLPRSTSFMRYSASEYPFSYRHSLGTVDHTDEGQLEISEVRL
jgi:hypothetical protein